MIVANTPGGGAVPFPPQSDLGQPAGGEGTGGSWAVRELDRYSAWYIRISSKKYDTASGPIRIPSRPK